VKIERLTSNFATVCYTGKSSRYQKENLGLQRASHQRRRRLIFASLFRPIVIAVERSCSDFAPVLCYELAQTRATLSFKGLLSLSTSLKSENVERVRAIMQNEHTSGFRHRQTLCRANRIKKFAE
jgi:hypothetical protein